MFSCWKTTADKLFGGEGDDLDIIMSAEHHDAYMYEKVKYFSNFEQSMGSLPRWSLIPEYILRESEWKNAIYFSKY